MQMRTHTHGFGRAHIESFWWLNIFKYFFFFLEMNSRWSEVCKCVWSLLNKLFFFFFDESLIWLNYSSTIIWNNYMTCMMSFNGTFVRFCWTMQSKNEFCRIEFQTKIRVNTLYWGLTKMCDCCLLLLL